MKKYRVLIIHKGSRIHTWCEDLRVGFEMLGHDAVSIALRDRTAEERHIEKREKQRYFSNPATIERISGAILSHRPALIILLNYIGLPEQAHAELRKAANGAPFVAWLADHVEKPPQECLPNLDAVYAFDSATLPMLRDFYLNTPTRIDFLSLAVNPERFKNCGRPWSARKNGLVFVGNHTSDRLSVIRELRSFGADVSCYGPGASSSWRIWRRCRQSPETTAQLYGGYQAVLNMLQYPNTIHGLNLRAFEIPACGGLGTYPETPDLARSFEPGEEIITYRDHIDLIEQLDHLKSNYNQADRIIQNGLDRTLSDHTYCQRAQSLMST